MPTDDWAFEVGGEQDLYLWDRSQEDPGRDRGHFLHKEHLHLIDKENDVAVSTKHPKPETTNRAGVWEKISREDKAPEYLTGIKAVQKGESPEISLCTTNKPLDDVFQWQIELIQTLRARAKEWLRVHGNKGQFDEFVA